MNRNSNAHFAMLPTTGLEHSTFPMYQNIRTTFNTGDIIPFYVDSDCMPGDHFTYHYTLVMRGTTPLWPTMDNAYADIYWFKIPHRILWTHFKNQMGEVKDVAWFNSTEYVTPMFKTPEGGMATGTIAEKMGIPIKVANLEFSQLPIRGYTMIYNYFFRDQNLIAPEEEFTDDTDRTASNTVTNLGGVPYKAAKKHDYYTSCLPDVQRGPAVRLPLGKDAPIQFQVPTAGEITAENTKTYRNINYTGNPEFSVTTTGFANTNIGNLQTADGPVDYLTIDNSAFLKADLANAIAATINAQRLAFQTMKIYERDARGGARFNELIYSHFLTQIGDSRYQIPEYLGGKSIPIKVDQILQTSQGTTTSPLGQTGAYSLTVDSDFQFATSITEWSIIIGLIVVRTDHSYSQGLNKQWTRRRRFDYYWPALDHIGEQPVLNEQIYAQGTETDKEVFGYQEAWAEYRYKPSMNTGYFNPRADGSLSSWHYGDSYDSLPLLGKEWIEETTANVDRTLTVQSNKADQWFMDSLVTIKASRPMATYSVPGYVDHF